MKKIINAIVENLELLVESPKDYLYSFLDSSRDQVIMVAFDPRSLSVSAALKRRILALDSGLKFHLIGSAGLGIAGRKDLDIYIECPPRKFKSLSVKISRLLNSQPVFHRGFVEWHTSFDGFHTDLTLIDPASPRLLDQLKLFNLLKHNPVYLKEYEQLKLSCQGLSSRVYVRRRMHFFNRILSTAKSASPAFA